jgi:hypothetical protein
LSLAQGYNVLGQRATKRANNGAVLNFGLCDLQKYVKSKTLVLCHVSLLDIPMPKKIGDDPAISSGVIALYVFSVLAPCWPNQESDWTEIWSVSYSYLVVHMYKVSGQ